MPLYMDVHDKLPDGVMLYEIAGPFFFGSTEKAMGALATVAGKARAVILYMGAVPAMDVTGLVALESSLKMLHASGAMVVIAVAVRSRRSRQR